jgi:hypothetical protein
MTVCFVLEEGMKGATEVRERGSVTILGVEEYFPWSYYLRLRNDSRD